jgi:glycosyltransferase involved in cell wall biosynthesis
MSLSKPDRIVFISEDLSLPLDEGMKKYNYSLIRFIQGHFNNHKFYSCIIDDPTIIYEKLAGKSLFSIRLLRNLRKYDPDLIVYSPLASGTLSSFLRLFLVKITCRNSKTVLINLQRRQHGAADKMIIRLVAPSKVVVFSGREYDYFKSINLKPLISRTGVDLIRFSPVSPEMRISIRKKYGFATNDIILLHAGHINHGRNIEVLPTLIDKDIKILVVGSTSTSVDHELKENLIRKGVRVIDSFIENIEEIYQMSDAYVFPVRNDHSAIEFPLSVLEAMACNLPVVTTPYGSLSDYFKQGCCFAYFETGEDLKSQVSNVLQSECNNRQMVTERFSWEVVFGELFETLLCDDPLSDRN